MSKLEIGIKLLTEGAKVPTRKSGDAAFDLYASESHFLGVNVTGVISTGIALSIPHGWYAQIETRSGMAVQGLSVLGGVVDSSYTGEVKVILQNCHTFMGAEYASGYKINKGDRIGQIVFHKVPEVEFITVETLPETNRNSNGFGSTGR